ncbi:MAG: hypothetical protein DWQ49_09590 [Bacteroidetes bacterium]|nr:MAG: hypothetical protein DWQ49_09590 [Bacteroidota bacterium]
MWSSIGSIISALFKIIAGIFRRKEDREKRLNTEEMKKRKKAQDHVDLQSRMEELTQKIKNSKTEEEREVYLHELRKIMAE